MSQANFSRAAMPNRFRVAKLALCQHSIGHAMLLQRLGNAYAGRPTEASVAQDPSLGELALAVWICQRTASRAVRTIDRPWTKLAIYLTGWRLARHGLPDAHKEMLAYLMDSWPEIRWWKVNNGQTRSLGADLQLRLCLAMTRTGLDLDEVLEVPHAVAVWYMMASAEEQGAISLVSPQDEGSMEIFKALKAAGRLPTPGTVIERKSHGR